MMAALMAMASGCGVAMAQDAATIHPPLTPTRDVQVDYNVQPDGVPEPKAVRTWFAYNGGSCESIARRAWARWSSTA
ncbi:hypothetical protein [Komagataeibacter kakiaceti]|uniref:hypothetical protein n=1 Tax=Komagataeibacter kakiaceti TaxID=943261 RepID=UPI000ABE357C|nr:hypothetical protein [Komagataeibacter kakiaceti]